MNRELLQDFVLMQTYDHLLRCLQPYHLDSITDNKQINNFRKVIYEKIFLKIRDEYTLNDSEAHELYLILRKAYNENTDIGELCFQSCLFFCLPVVKDAILEQELNDNYCAHSRDNH